MSSQSQQCLFLQLAHNCALELLKSVNFDRHKVGAMLLDMQNMEAIRKQASITFGDVVLDTKDLEVFGKLVRENLRILKKPNVNFMDPLKKAVLRVCSTPALDLYDAYIDEHVGSGKSVGISLRLMYPDLVTLTEESAFVYNGTNITVRRDFMYDGHGASVGYFYYVRVAGQRQGSISFCGKVSGLYYEEGPILPVLVGALSQIVVQANLVNIILTGDYKTPKQILDLSDPCDEHLLIEFKTAHEIGRCNFDMRLDGYLFTEFVADTDPIGNYQKAEDVTEVLDKVLEFSSLLRKATSIIGLR